ncbi:class I SAM-dependent methyltransferase [Pseudohongiella spirulinae]|uniref:Methyltransferase type 11 n=1 Tax=Pseudohongiella spirulinae TaxID=1249552 RepID=A0A0S2KBW0_9GAMM|nr:class I SAM-dependent methyltransferase [Pseudohongiella spirulinae]ALO45800.1 hypothetical protein PS2015_1138 [Pseudohongiella spirulinae]
MSGFSIEWLNLREDADRRARSQVLLDKARHWLCSGKEKEPPQLIADMGAGTGSTLRAFSEKETGFPALRWRLLDNDQALLNEAQRRHGTSHDLELCRVDLSETISLPLSDARLITASALFDLVSAGFIDAVIDSGIGVYAALNYNGISRWTPAHPLDDTVLQAFNSDQRRDKGFGPALGPESSSYMIKAFSRAGYTVETADSPWILNGVDQMMVSMLIDGIADAVRDHALIKPKALQEWIDFRQSTVSTGTCIIGHTDVLALPNQL